MSRVMQWAVLLAAGALTTVGLLGIATIGLLLLVLAGLLMAVVIGGDRGFGQGDLPVFLLGGAAALTVFGVLAFPYEPCHAGEMLVDPPGPGQRNSCGGFSPALYLVPAAALVAGAIAATVDTLRNEKSPG